MADCGTHAFKLLLNSCGIIAFQRLLFMTIVEGSGSIMFVFAGLGLGAGPARPPGPGPPGAGGPPAAPRAGSPIPLRPLSPEPHLPVGRSLRSKRAEQALYKDMCSNLGAQEISTSALKRKDGKVNSQFTRKVKNAWKKQSNSQKVCQM